MRKNLPNVFNSSHVYSSQNIKFINPQINPLPKYPNYINDVNLYIQYILDNIKSKRLQTISYNSPRRHFQKFVSHLWLSYISIWHRAALIPPYVRHQKSLSNSSALSLWLEILRIKDQHGSQASSIAQKGRIAMPDSSPPAMYDQCPWDSRQFWNIPLSCWR